ncbi:MAG TPA: Yip1 family protein [Vicinamibacterales bacterium]|nr:Yip1 family protein [Vicinamibacterales bacterium]
MADLKTRVVNILTTPQTEWPLISVEKTDAATLTASYIAILAAIPPVATYIGMTVVGVGTFTGARYRTDPTRGLVSAVLQYLLAVAGVHVAALVVDRLAPTFKSQPSAIQALKLVTYASTALWVAGAVNIVPTLSEVAFLAGLYSIYLFYLGVGPVMKTPADQVLPYMVVSAVVVIVITLAAAALAAALASAI